MGQQGSGVAGHLLLYSDSTGDTSLLGLGSLLGEEAEQGKD